MDEGGNPLKKVEFSGDYDSEDEVASVDNDMIRSMDSEKDLPQELQAICDNLDIRVRGPREKGCWVPMAEEVGVEMVEVASNVEGEEEDGLGGDGFVVDGGRSPSTSSRDGEDGRVENKSLMGSRLIATGEIVVERLLEKLVELPMCSLIGRRRSIVKKGKTQEVGVKKMAKNCELFIKKDGQE
ncbi:hypothetical protein Tco_0917811 [Tanacetum coccineum]